MQGLVPVSATTLVVLVTGTYRQRHACYDVLTFNLHWNQQVPFYTTVWFRTFFCSSLHHYLSFRSISCCQSKTRVLLLSGEVYSLVVSQEGCIVPNRPFYQWILPDHIAPSRFTGSNSQYFATGHRAGPSYLHIGSSLDPNVLAKFDNNLKIDR